MCRCQGIDIENYVECGTQRQRQVRAEIRSQRMIRREPGGHLPGAACTSEIQHEHRKSDVSENGVGTHGVQWCIGKACAVLARARPNDH